jgi:hypothetical protein
MPVSLVGHHINRFTVDQGGDVHLNGCKFYNDAGLDISSSLEVLNDIVPGELNVLDGAIAGTVVAEKAVVVDASKDIGTFGAMTAASLTLSGTTATALTLSGVNATSGILFSGTIDRCLDFGTLTVGTTTDGVLMRAGTGIGASGLAFGTANMRAFALYLRYTATSGTFKGMRLRCIADPSSGAASMDNFHCQTSVIASKDAATINGGFFEIIPKGTNVIDFARCILTNVDSAAAVTFTTGLVNTHIRTHTRGDETMSGVDEMLRIENEAVGVNGRQMDSFIRCMEFNISGGIKSAAYLIDAGVSTALLATAVMRLPDDEVTSWDDATGAGDTAAGAIKVVIGSATRYIKLYSDAP